MSQILKHRKKAVIHLHVCTALSSFALDLSLGFLPSAAGAAPHRRVRLELGQSLEYVLDCIGNSSSGQLYAVTTRLFCQKMLQGAGGDRR